MATFEELKTGLETAFDPEGAKGVEATIRGRGRSGIRVSVAVGGRADAGLPRSRRARNRQLSEAGCRGGE